MQEDDETVNGCTPVKVRSRNVAAAAAIVEVEQTLKVCNGNSKGNGAATRSAHGPRTQSKSRKTIKILYASVLWRGKQQIFKYSIYRNYIVYVVKKK